jgi:hypothetical protein
MPLLPGLHLPATVPLLRRLYLPGIKLTNQGGAARSTPPLLAHAN